MIILIAATLLGLYMAWNIGANDVANSMADAVGSRALSVRRAVVAAAIFEFLGAVLVGAHVTDTVRKGIVTPTVFAHDPGLFAMGMACSLLAAALWLNLASWWGMPVSTTHSIVGAIAGFGLVVAGLNAVNWHKLSQIIMSWLISPMAGGVMAYLIFRVTVWLILGRDRPTTAAVYFVPFIVFYTVFMMSLATIFKGLGHIIHEKNLAFLTGANALVFSAAAGLATAAASRILLRKAMSGWHHKPLEEQLERVERSLAPLVIFTSCCVAFAHGSNDVANAIGPLAAIVDVIRTNAVKLKVAVPLWVLALGGMGIALGLATYGYRVMYTVGTRITQLTPSRGIAADVATATVVLVCSRMKLPISTTHTIVGAIFGVGMARGLAAVDSRVVKQIAFSWLLTVPVTAALSAILVLAAWRTWGG
ncbi:MAG TPA: inorganic phosphate transporter [Kiritimatiellae bacterium]|nr:inorganic phosphate transporter [Kiritimatiellia bacterium]